MSCSKKFALNILFIDSEHSETLVHHGVWCRLAAIKVACCFHIVEPLITACQGSAFAIMGQIRRFGRFGRKQ